MTERFPLAPAVNEENRGVDPDVLRDIGYELPFDHIPEDATAIVGDAPEAQSDNVVGIQDAPGSPEVRAATIRSRRHPVLKELPSRERGSNTHGLATPAQVQRGLSTEKIAEQREINRRRASLTRIALNSSEEE